MTEERTIKKYPNRRLYDMAISSYITLQDVKNLVSGGVSIKVIDAKTQADLSAQTLLQIICDQEQKNQPLFSTAVLESLIRLYNSPVSNQVNRFLEQSLDFFVNQSNETLQDGVPHGENSKELSTRNEALWRDILNQDTLIVQRDGTDSVNTGSSTTETV